MKALHIYLFGRIAVECLFSIQLDEVRFIFHNFQWTHRISMNILAIVCSSALMGRYLHTLCSTEFFKARKTVCHFPKGLAIALHGFFLLVFFLVFFICSLQALNELVNGVLCIITKNAVVSWVFGIFLSSSICCSPFHNFDDSYPIVLFCLQLWMKTMGHRNHRESERKKQTSAKHS